MAQMVVDEPGISGRALRRPILCLRQNTISDADVGGCEVIVKE